MNFDDFFAELKNKRVDLTQGNYEIQNSHRLNNEALFHLPLLAMTVLLLSSNRSKPQCDEIGQLVGECFERTFVGFKGSSQLIGWSANLRMRTVRALTFLELSGLVKVEKHHEKFAVTEAGKAVLTKAMSGDGDLSHSLHLIERRYSNIRAEKQIKLGLM